LFTISVETYFWASHRLTLADGSKEPVHHHNWRVTADISSDGLDDAGLVMDFRWLKSMLDDIVAEFVDAQLDKLDYFDKNNPSVENVARNVYERLEPKLPARVKLACVGVVEQPGCSAKFDGSNTQK
jgi:6-pyruvoyltetrahydropterin/6-carboxytetrahydropterin synthase